MHSVQVFSERFAEMVCDNIASERAIMGAVCSTIIVECAYVI